MANYATVKPIINTRSTYKPGRIKKNNTIVLFKGIIHSLLR